MIRLPEGRTLEDVFDAIPSFGEDPDIRAMLEDIYLRGRSIYSAANIRCRSGESDRTYNTLYYHGFRAQREINQLFGRSADDLVDELVSTGSLTVAPERVSEVDMVCKVLGVKSRKQITYKLER